MIAIYDYQPAPIEPIGNGAYTYAYDIRQLPADSDGANQPPRWQAQTVTVWPPLTSNSILAAAIADRWPLDREQKLVNDFNAANLGLLDDSAAQTAIDAYRSYLTDRSALKAQVENDCLTANIL